MLNLKDFKTFEVKTSKIVGGITKDGIRAVVDELGCWGSNPHPQCDNICFKEHQIEG